MRFLAELCAVQALPVGLLLIVAGAIKALRPVHMVSLERTVFSLLARSRLSLLSLWRGLGWLELVLGAALLALPGRGWPAALSAAQLAVAAGYLVWSRRRAPDKSCGCMGSRRSEAVSARTIARTAALAVAALLAALLPLGWPAALRDPAILVVLAVEAAALVWAFVARPPAQPKPTAPPKLQDCATAPGPPLADLLAALKQSPLWQQTRHYLKSEEYSEEWREGCYLFFCFPAEYQQTPATAVFAASIRETDADYRVALVHEETSTVLLQAPG